MRASARLELVDVSKRFAGVQALDRVSLDLCGGEIHALLGENGAGKTTLMNVLYGLLPPDAGLIRIDGHAVQLRSPQEARRLGIGMVHQHFTVVDRFTTTENLALSFPDDGLRFDRRRTAARASALARQVGLDIGDPDALAESLAVGVRQRLEILKALAGEARVLILDEPTAVLTPQEVAQLFTVLRRLRAEGRIVVLITHKLQEARAIADRVTVLRRGRVVGDGTPATLSDTELATMMVGAPPLSAGHAHQPRETELLRLEGLRLRAAPASEAGINLCVRGGEIVGIVGVDGNGQTELFEVLAGLRTPASGTVRVVGVEVPTFTPAHMLAAGIGIIPPDRRHDGLVGALTVAENVALSRVLLDRLARHGVLRRAALRSFAVEQARRFQIRESALDAPAATLSGGNQQRVIVARALAGGPDVLVAFNPTRGLDIGASRAVYDILGAFVAGGKGVLLISTDLDEVLELSDRVAVLFRHELSPALMPPYAIDQIGLMMAGGVRAPSPGASPGQ